MTSSALEALAWRACAPSDCTPSVLLARRALDRVAGGAWWPLVTGYPLAEAARAHADLEAREALGKVVLRVDGTGLSASRRLSGWATST